MNYFTKDLSVIAKEILAALHSIKDRLTSLRNNVQENTHAITEANKRENEKQHVTPEVPAESRLPKSIEIHKSASETCDDRKRHRHSLFVQWCTFLAVLGYAVLVYFQYREMINATDAANLSIGEARNNRRQAEKAFNATVEQFRLDQRAWISISQDDILLTDGKPILIPFHLVNTGKTVAFNIQGNIAVNIVKQGEEPEFVYSKNTGHPHTGFRAGIIFPGSKLSPNVPFIEVGPKSPTIPLLTSEVHQKITKGELSIITHGKLTYSDVFNRQHWVTFCSDTLGRSRKCIEYNNVDR